ncbi:MAG: class I SAM-dependent methyltransferase [Winogradskyella sp.]|uniref:class I SAM-dependent methyltransferase n=1 Tax=Winogradskyella sp. TaxID=1883156 RepID=UPI000F40A8EA|nr:class I SAM-dependent methyltransferase [Winogradskyella sp.]RNC88153.1 MAG: class I SAM-dependent methyltransferase [Winogradskyella sp.]
MGKKTHLTVKDYSVSKETFELIFNNEKDILETIPRPKKEDLSNYYKSEDYISHTDSRRNLLEVVYHIIRKKALKNKLSLIASFQQQEKNLLDVGCGTGDFLETALNANWNVVGVEPNQGARDIANSKTNNKVYDVESLPNLEPNSFDVITLWHVLEHLPNLDDHISVFKKLLKPNGKIVVAVPNYKSYDAAYYKSFWAAYDVPRHLWHFSQKGIQRIFEAKKLLLEKTQPMIFDAYYVSLLSEKYKNGFMNPFKAFWIGWRSNRKAKHSREFSSLIYVFKNA